jgi:hypothetical protein
MANTPLVVYLQDHLAGSAAAVEILDGLRTAHAGQPLGQLAFEISEEVETDRSTLQSLIERLGGGSSPLKDTTAWLGAKLSRYKLGGDLSDPLGALEGLEVVALGILGKRALWEALSGISATDSRLRELDLRRLIDRASAQYARVEAQRLETARRALR